MGVFEAEPRDDGSVDAAAAGSIEPSVCVPWSTIFFSEGISTSSGCAAKVRVFLGVVAIVLFCSFNFANSPIGRIK